MPQVAESYGGLLPGDSHLCGWVWELDVWKSQISWSEVSIQVGDHAGLGWGLSQQKATIPLSDVLVCLCPALVPLLLMVKDCSCLLYPLPIKLPPWHGIPEKSLVSLWCWGH